MQSIIEQKENQLKEKLKEKPQATIVAITKKKAKDGSIDANRSDDSDKLDKKRKRSTEKAEVTPPKKSNAYKEDEDKGQNIASEVKPGSFPTKQFKAVDPDEENTDSSDSDLLT